MTRLNIPTFQQPIISKTRMELPWYQFFNKQAEVVDAFYVTTMEAYGATGGNTVNDTKALQRAMSGAGTILDGRGKEYYISEGVSCAERTYIKNIRLKLKMGTGGFTGVDNKSATRYDTEHVLLHWDGVDGGGIENIEVYGDGGGEYICSAVCVSAGMDTKPFLMSGVNYFHDLTGISAIIRMNGVADAGYFADTLYFRDIGTTKDSTWWLTSGAASSLIQVTCFSDGDDSGQGAIRGRIARILGYNIFETDAAWADPAGQGQVDLVTLAGVDYEEGTHIGYIYGEDVMGEVLDCFKNGVHVDRIVAKDTGFAICKLIHGADNCHIGNVHSLGGVGRLLVAIQGSNTAVDTANNTIDSVTGDFSLVVFNSGTLVSATATTAVLAVGASSRNDYYFKAGGSWAIKLIAGTGAPAEVTITDYTGSTRTVTVASWPSGTPDNTTTYKIVQFQARAAVAIEGEGSGTITNNTVTVNGVKNTEGMDYIARTNITVSNKGNVVVINKDMRYDTQAVYSDHASARGVRFRVGPGQKSQARIGLSGNQSISSTAETLVTFDTSREDTYTYNGAAGQQVDTANNGIWQLLPGPKRFSISLHYTTVIADQTVEVRLQRDGTGVYRWVHQFGAGTGGSTAAFSGSIDHQEIWFGGTKNFYRVTVEHSTASAMVIAATAADTWFEMTDV